jgi:hypothetical protein
MEALQSCSTKRRIVLYADNIITITGAGPVLSLAKPNGTSYFETVLQRDSQFVLVPQD